MAFFKPSWETSGETNTADTMVSDFQPLDCEENKFPLFRPSSLWYFVIAAPGNWDTLGSYTGGWDAESFLGDGNTKMGQQVGEDTHDVPYAGIVGEGVGTVCLWVQGSMKNWRQEGLGIADTKSGCLDHQGLIFLHWQG